MNRKTWIAAAVLLLGAGAAGGYWWMQLQQSVERTIAAKLRATKKLAMDVKLQRGNYYDEEMKQDVKSVADSFKIIPTEGPVRTDSKISAAVYDLESEFQLILWLFPPDVVNLNGTFYRVDPAFWNTLLANAPKTAAFLKESETKGNNPKERKSKGRPTAAKAPAVEESNDKGSNAKDSKVADAKDKEPKEKGK